MSLHEIVGCGARPYPPSGLESDNCTIWFMSDHSAADPKETTQVVHLVVFCGFVGSGKTSLAVEAAKTWPGEWDRCCQDEMKSRQSVERRARASLLDGRHVLIDRTNMDRQQRAIWLSLAADVRQVRSVVTSLIHVDVPPEICYERLLHRQGHPTLRTPEQAHRYVHSTMN
ncbi:hypothetical protein MGL_3521 [Malassezia globosa CBS 7966]|uniref:Uncharacterized protein n=1 Tax=Malassezia globosa (strain ATCC MYA-4612 / CBS 7966) TaxID=425265 RepID=A8Q9N8_MALGO|nr:uncharacterized protein MGL_3521 [Malassezia globosa CBS 7966]EDP42272.1 hypothetical protein MGL_3521 [Malassezia globosa CBS 7966]